MSGRIVREVLDHAPADLTAAEMLVLIVLAEEARDVSRQVCVPAVEIAHRARLALRTVHNVLSELASRGLVARQNRARVGTTQRYLVMRLVAEHREFTVRSLTVPGTTSLTPEGTTPPVDNGVDVDGSLTVEGSEPHWTVSPLRTPPVDPSGESVETRQVSGWTT